MGSSFLNALVNAFDKLHIVRAENSGYSGSKYRRCTSGRRLRGASSSPSTAMAFGTKLHYQIRQIAPRHFFQTAGKAGAGRQVIESIIQELLEGTSAAVDSVLSKLPKKFPEQVASSIAAGIKRRLVLLQKSKDV
jgi:hypothetical protein